MSDFCSKHTKHISIPRFWKFIIWSLKEFRISAFPIIFGFAPIQFRFQEPSNSQKDAKKDVKQDRVKENTKKSGKQGGKDNAKSDEHEEKNEYNIYAVLYLFKKIWV